MRRRQRPSSLNGKLSINYRDEMTLMFHGDCNDESKDESSFSKIHRSKIRQGRRVAFVVLTMLFTTATTITTTRFPPPVASAFVTPSSSSSKHLHHDFAGKGGRQQRQNNNIDNSPAGLGFGGGETGIRRNGRNPFSFEKRQYNVKVKPLESTRKNRQKQDDKDEMRKRDRWFSWMARGSRSESGTDKVKFREAEELGGVPRTDRYSSSDWLHNTISLPNSAILKAIRFPVIFMTSWATFLSCVHWKLLTVNPIAANFMCIPSAPHSLMVSALSLLLVFKTNSAYQRFAEGRKIWESIINRSRDLYRMMTLYENELGKNKRRRLQRLLAAFPYLLRHRIRPSLIMFRLDDESNVRDPEHSIVLYQDKAADDLDPEAAAVARQEESEGKSRRKARPLYWVDKRTLPWRLLPKDAMEGCARAQNRPLWVCDRMAQELRNVPDGPNFTNRERLALISKVEKLSSCIGACERIHQTAVPLNYARHSLRALTLWLFTLPFALMDSLRMVTGPVLFLVSWLLFGVYEIGYSIEDPFQGTLRLSVLCDTIRRDVLAHEVFRYTAFSVRDAVEEGSADDSTDDEEDDYESSPVPVEEPNIAQVVEELPTIPIQSDEKNQTTWYIATDESGTMLFNKKP